MWASLRSLLLSPRSMDYDLPDQPSSSGPPNSANSQFQQIPMILNLPPESSNSAPATGANMIFDQFTKTFYHQLPDPKVVKTWSCLYPIYFDLTVTGSSGRRVAYGRSKQNNQASSSSADEASIPPEIPAPSTSEPTSSKASAKKKSRSGRSSRPAPPPPPPGYRTPDVMAIMQACHTLGLPAVMEKKRHPQDPFRWGRVRVNWRVEIPSPAALRGKSTTSSESSSAPKNWNYINPAIRCKRQLIGAISAILPESQRAAGVIRRTIAERMKMAGHAQHAQLVMQGYEEGGNTAAGAVATAGGGTGQDKAEVIPGGQSPAGGGGKKKKGKK
ncbi:hypothetical protein HDU93_006396 [Gonapodya sp. JEL0774]|nr:hypothetical protein HDU93_006396 [Gonapodya sp. JEL0774]